MQVIDGTPTCIQRSDTGNTGYWWPTDDYARYGDVAAYADVNSEYIYAIGGVPNSVTSWPDTEYVYQLRVPADQLYVLDAYEYWWGRETGWSKEILTSFNETTAVMWGVGGGQIVWSEYFKVYIFAHLGMSSILLAAQRLQEHRGQHGQTTHCLQSRRPMECRCYSLYTNSL